jgi:hypothetical protein
VITDYTGLLPLECKSLSEFVAEQYHQQAAPVGGAALPALAGAQWWPLLQTWRDQRLQIFDQMLLSFDARHVGDEAIIARSNTARVLEIGVPSSWWPSVQFDRRLIFTVTADNNLSRLEALSPLVRLQVLKHYPPVPSGDRGAQMFDESLRRMLGDTQLISNDAKGRMVEGYILHRIRMSVSQHAADISIPNMHGHPWTQTRGDIISFDFSRADVVDFPGGGLPPASLLGDLSHPKFYIPLRSNYPEFDLFMWLPGAPAAGRKRKVVPSSLLRCSITVDITGHVFNPNLVDLAAWRGVIPLAPAAGIPALGNAPYVWMGPDSQNAPVAARNQSLLLSLEAMANNGFPLLDAVKLR